MNSRSNNIDEYPMKLTPQHEAEIHALMIRLGYITKPKVVRPSRYKKSTLFMITPSPDPAAGMTLSKFHSLIKARLKKVWIEKFWYCFELSKSGNLHAHILIQTCEPVVTSKVRKGFVFPDSNVKAHPFTNLQNGLTYLQGFKLGEPKPMHSDDIKYRQKNNLADIYTNNGPCKE